MTDRRAVLLVEDDAEIRVALCEVLCDYFDVVAASSVAEARAAITKKQVWYAALIDVRMPVEDGCVLAKELKAQKFQGMIIGISAVAGFAKDKVTPWPFDKRMPKPFSIEGLLEALKIKE